jgi:hypothetical protein
MGAGVQVQEVNRLLNQFEQTQKMMKQFSKGGMGKLMRGMKGMMPGMGGVRALIVGGLRQAGRLVVFHWFCQAARTMLGYSGLPRLPL